MQFTYTKEQKPGLGINRQPRFVTTITVESAGDTAPGMPMQIEATVEGVRLAGHMPGFIETQEEMKAFAEACATAFIDHLALRKKLRAKLMVRK